MKLLSGKAAGYSGKVQTPGGGRKFVCRPVRTILAEREIIGKTWLAAVLLLATIISCAGHGTAPHRETGHGAGYGSSHAVRPGREARRPPVRRKRPATESEAAARLEQAWRSWRGTPHRLGGRDKRGIDCSGLVQVIYRDFFGIRLPRMVSAQVRLGRKVSRRDLRPGDLVFFRPPGKYRHVGIYMGNQRFLHTSARHGVMVSRISDYYWRNCYWTARRYW